MKYNRAFIIRTAHSIPILEDYDSGAEDDRYWLLESGDSFHGQEDGKAFYFKDSRLPVMSLPLEWVVLEFDETELEIERLQKENSILKSKLDDFKTHGLRADMNPTQPIGDWMKVTEFYLDYLKRIETSVKERAKY